VAAVDRHPVSPYRNAGFAAGIAADRIGCVGACAANQHAILPATLQQRYPVLMRRSVAITLVILGAAGAGATAIALNARECTDPATGAPVRCSSGSHHGGASYMAGGSRSFASAGTAAGAAAGAAAAATAARGGFGGSGSSFSGFSG